MAYQSRLSKPEWLMLRRVWELDPRPGFMWAIHEFGLNISGAGVRKKASQQGWKKAEPDYLEDGLDDKSPDGFCCCCCCKNHHPKTMDEKTIPEKP